MLNAYAQFVVGNKIIIPHGVTEIGDYAFECCEDIISISIPSSIKRIGENAFSGSFRLTSIEIPWSVERIGNGAFSYCPMLSSISVDDGNKFYFSAGNSIIDRISGDKLVVGCSSTRIPSYIREIGAYAFLGCTSLNSIALPNSVKYISEGAFMRCNLSDVDLSSIREIGGSAFRSCESLSRIKIPFGCTRIDDYAFDSCINLVSVEIPNSVLEIGVFAFQGTGLSHISLPGGLKYIKEGAFFNCDHLKSIELPRTIMSIGREAFMFDQELSDIYLQSPYPADNGLSKSGLLPEHITLHVPYGSEENYRRDLFFSRFKKIVPIV